MYSKLQYISQGSTPAEQLLNMKTVLDIGCSWIQLRFKNRPENETIALAEEASILSRQYNATLIINDSVDIAKYVDADGVHLGLHDETISQARSILGHDKIIGGTANTFQDVKQRIKEQCNYIGLGPFRYTETKEKLSPILGMAGYEAIFSELGKTANHIPIYAIGGIKAGDIDEIMKTGVYGLAVSTALMDTHQQSLIIQKLTK